MHGVTVNGSILHYILDGQPEGERGALVFINSLGTDHQIWDGVLPHVMGLAGYGPVLRYDKRGHGLSDSPPPPYSIRDHAADLAALLDSAGIGAAVLIGISVGGQIAQQVAALYPARVRGLVLCDTGAKIGTVDTWNSRIEAVRRGGMAAVAEAVLARWLTAETIAACPELARICHNMLLRTPAEGYIGTCAALRDADLTEAARGIRAPTLVVCGEQDAATPPDLARALAALIPGAALKLVEGVAHLPCLEQPEVLGAIIRTFLEGLTHG